MHARPFAAVSLLLTIACGPGAPADTADTGTDSEGGTTVPTTGAPDPPTTTDPDPTGEPDPTTDATPTTDGPDPTTGDPVTCPEGQAAWTALASAPLAAPDEVVLPMRSRTLVPMLDGNLALTAATSAPGQAAALLRVSAVGAVLGLAAGAPSPVDGVSMLTIERAGDGGLVLLGRHKNQATTRPFLARFAADGTPVGEVSLVEGRRTTETMVLVDGAVVLAAHDVLTQQRLAFKVDLETGAELWSTELVGPADLTPTSVVRGPQGELVVGGMAVQGATGFTSVQLYHLTDDGAIVWAQGLETAPYDVLADLASTPDGQIVALKFGSDPDYNVGLLAADLASGDPLWEHLLAVTDESGRPVATRLHVDADALTIPVARSVPAMLSRATVEAWRVSFAGEPLERIALPDIPAGGDSFAFLASVRGACGELVIVVGEQEKWFAAFAP